VMVTVSPGAPLEADKPEIAGGLVTVKGVPVLAIPLTVTTTLPDTAPAGTSTVMLVSLH